MSGITGWFSKVTSQVPFSAKKKKDPSTEVKTLASAIFKPKDTKEESIKSSVKNISHECDRLILATSRIAKTEVVYQYAMPKGCNFIKSIDFYNIHGKQLREDSTAEELNEISDLRLLTKQNAIEESHEKLKALEKVYPQEVSEIKKLWRSHEHKTRQLEGMPDSQKKTDLTNSIKGIETQVKSLWKEIVFKKIMDDPSIESSLEVDLEIQQLESKIKNYTEVKKICKELSSNRIKLDLFKEKNPDLKTNEAKETVLKIKKNKDDLISIFKEYVDYIPYRSGLKEIKELVLSTDRRTIDARQKTIGILEKKIEKAFKDTVFTKIRETLELGKTNWEESDTTLDRIKKTVSWVYKRANLSICHLVYDLTGFFASDYIRGGVELAEQTMVNYAMGLEKEEKNLKLRKMVYDSVNKFLETFDNACRGIAFDEKNKPQTNAVPEDGIEVLNKDLEGRIAKKITIKEPREFLQLFMETFLEETVNIGEVPREIVLSLLKNSETVSLIFTNLQNCLKSPLDDSTFALDQATTLILNIAKKALELPPLTADEIKNLTAITKTEDQAVDVLVQCLLEAIDFASCDSKAEVVRTAESLPLSSGTEDATNQQLKKSPGYLGAGLAIVLCLIIIGLGGGFALAGGAAVVGLITGETIADYLDKDGNISEKKLKEIIIRYVKNNKLLIVNQIRCLLKPETSLGLIETSLKNFHEILFTDTEISSDQKTEAKEERDKAIKETSDKVIDVVAGELVSFYTRGNISPETTKKIIPSQSKNICSPTVKKTIDKVSNLITRKSTVLYLIQSLLETKYNLAEMQAKKTKKKKKK